MIATCKCVMKDIGRYNTAKCDDTGQVIYNADGSPREVIQKEFHQVHLSFVGSKGDCWEREAHGTLPLVCLTPEAAEMFEVGKEYKVTLEPVAS